MEYRGFLAPAPHLYEKTALLHLRDPSKAYYDGIYRSLGGSLEGPLPDIITGAVPENSTHVYFKDMIVAASDDSEEESEPSERGATNQSGSEANNGKA